MAHLSPYHPQVFFRDLDTLHLDSLGRPSNEDRCYHLWALVFEYLGVLAFQHTQGGKHLTHAPQRACRVPPRLLHHQAPSSAEEFSSGIVHCLPQTLTGIPITAPLRCGLSIIPDRCTTDAVPAGEAIPSSLPGPRSEQSPRARESRWCRLPLRW